MVGRWWRECIIAFLLTFPSMARSNTAIAAIIPPVKAGYWYCQNDFPIPVSSIPSQLFTHLFAAFADVKPNTGGTAYEVTFPDEYRMQFSTFTQSLQKTNKKVKTLLSIGGFSDPSTATTFASMAIQNSTRKSFIDSSIKLARSNDFHGLGLHWLYPSTADQMANLGYLLDEWRAAVDKESKLTGNDPLLLVATVNYMSSPLPAVTYPVDAIAKSLDWINLVAYDFYNPALSKSATGPFAALLEGNGPKIPHYGDLGVNAWIQTPLTARKIVLGLPFYGAAWRLIDTTRTEIFAPANGPADGQAAGVYIGKDGHILYNQIQYFKETHSVGIDQYSPDYVVDYFSVGNTWIGYNGIKSITAKVTYARDKTLLGYYAWHVGGDRDGTLSRAASGAWPIPGPGQDIATGTSTGTGTGIATATATSTASGVGTVTGTVTSAITGTNTNNHTFICTNTCPAPAPSTNTCPAPAPSTNTASV